VVLVKTIGGRDYPVVGLATLGSVIYPVAAKFPSYASYSTASIDQIFSPSQLQQALHLQADTFASVYLQNDGNGRFTMTALPNLAQIAPIRGIVVRDVDGDG